MINYCARFMQNPQPRHFAMQLQVLCYAISIKDKGITYWPLQTVQELAKGYSMDCLWGAADATWGECRKTSKSTSGHNWSTDIGIISFYSGKQANVANSTCEADRMLS